MSELRRAARALVATREQTFESHHSLEESRRRLEARFAKADARGAVVFNCAWRTQDGRAVLEVTFAPPARLRRVLQGLSMGLAALVAASAWALVTRPGGASLAFLLPLVAVLTILGMPFVILGLNSRREAEEARITKAIRVALLDEQELRPRKYADED